MKTITLLLSGLTIAITACTQPEPPQNVKSTFEKLFTNAQKVTWSRENNTEWEAEFKLGDSRMSSNFDDSGKWLETEKALKKKDLPLPVMNTVRDQFPGYRLKEPEQVEKPGFKGYEAELEKGEKTLEVVFNSDGSLQTSQILEKNEDKD